MASSDGTEIAWPSVGDRRAPDGQPYLPNIASLDTSTDAPPRLVYQAPAFDSLLWPVAVRHGHYAFLESNGRLLGEQGWRLWSLPGPNATAVLLDHGDTSNGSAVPAFALSDDSVIWTVAHVRGKTTAYEIRSARADGSAPTVLLSSPADKVQYWFPSIDPAGAHLLYSTVEPVADAWRFRVWSLELGVPGAVPVRIGTSDDATEPLSNGSLVAWRTVDGNVLNWGAGLEVASLDGSMTRTTAVTHENDLSMGSRYIAFNCLDDSTDLRLYDTVADKIIAVEHNDADGPWGIQDGWSLVVGDLLVYRRVFDSSIGGPGDHPPEIYWARLP
jgi:hypothetical protein